jgi:hypothetical protein
MNMATTSSQVPSASRTKKFVERWYFTSMAIVMLAVSIVGFMPSIAHPTGRRAPLTLLAAAHGIVFFAWLLLFLVQSLLVATRRVGWHRRLGLASVFLLALIIPLSFTTTVEMARRGFDLSGDQHITPRPKPGKTLELDAATASVFNFVGLFMFAMLAIAAICYRRRPEIHKRLMLFANFELMGPPITHFLGHFPPLVLNPATVLFATAVFLMAGVARDYLVNRRIHALTAWLAIGMFVSFPLEGAVIGPSAPWHHFVAWLAR